MRQASFLTDRSARGFSTRRDRPRLPSASTHGWGRQISQLRHQAGPRAYATKAATHPLTARQFNLRFSPIANDLPGPRKCGGMSNHWNSVVRHRLNSTLCIREVMKCDARSQPLACWRLNWRSTSPHASTSQSMKAAWHMPLIGLRSWPAGIADRANVDLSAYVILPVAASAHSVARL